MKYRACDIQRYPNQTFQNIYYIWLFHRLKPLIRFVSCLRLLFSLKLSIRNSDQDFFHPRRIKDKRAPCAGEESLSKALAGSRSPPGRTVLGVRVGRSCPLCSLPQAAAPDAPLLLRGCLTHAPTATPRSGGNRASASRCGTLGNTWLFLRNK